MIWLQAPSLFVSGPYEVWAAAGAVMSGALRGQDRNYWTEGGWRKELALGANRCCNHKEIHNLWIKYEAWGQQEWRMMVTLPLLLSQYVQFVTSWSAGDWSVLSVKTDKWIFSSYPCFWKKDWDETKSVTEKKKKKRLLARRQLFATYCRFIMQKQRVSGRSMLCQSVLKHLRHSGSVMKSVEKRRIWQNVLTIMFYHKCFVSKAFYRHARSQEITSLSEYLMGVKTMSFSSDPSCYFYLKSGAF